MSAPDRIWYNGDMRHSRELRWEPPTCDLHPVHEYVRADLCTPAPDVSGLLAALRAMAARFALYGGPDGMHFGHHDAALMEQARAELVKWEPRA